MFKSAKIGDRVFDYLLQEWGTVSFIKDAGHKYPIRVQFAEIKKEYTSGGKDLCSYKLQTLFWNEMEPITPPEKPLPELEVDTRVFVWNSNDDIKFKRYFSHFDSNGSINCFKLGATSLSSNRNTALWNNWELAND